MGTLFGTDGIRGVANRPPMTPDLALAVGKAVVGLCREKGERHPLIVVGRDTRRSGPMLESAVVAGVCSAGGEALRLGVLPTPGVAHLLGEVNAAAGVVISASHNPYEDNGLKVFSARRVKLSDEEEERVEALIAATAGEIPAPTGGEIGTCVDMYDAADRYAAFCKSAFPGEDLAGYRVVLDCAHGATFAVAPAVFAGLGAQVHTLNNQPDGLNINSGCGSEHVEGLCQAVCAYHADAGLAFDGDGDRLVVVDETGNRLTGDQVIALCAKMYKERGWLERPVIVTTVMSNYGLKRALDNLRIEHVVSQVGDRRVVEAMEETGAVLGGEESGHLVFRRHHTTGDGIIAGLQVLGVMQHYGRPLSELARVMTVMPQIVVNVEVSAKPPLESLPELATAVAKAEAVLAGDGRVLVRYSGTQAMCRVMVEGPDSKQIHGIASELATIIRRQIGSL